MGLLVLHHAHQTNQDHPVTLDRRTGHFPIPRLPQTRPRTIQKRSLVIVTAIALLSVAWLLLIFSVEPAQFVVAAPQAKTGFEVLLAVGQLFGALVLGIFPNPRLRWAALGLFILGTGALGFAYLFPIIDDRYTLETMLYGSGYVRSAALILIVISLLPERTPAFTLERAITVLGIISVGGILLATFAESLPPLIDVSGVDALTTGAGSTLPGLTSWHWALSPFPLVLAVLATYGALRHFPGEALGGWLVAALALFAGAQLHSIFWPSIYSSVMTSSSFLRLAFTLVLVTGGILELRILLAQRDALLAEEQERLRRLQELGRMKDDFTAIVAHELSSPVGAVGALADVLAVPDLTPEQRAGMTDALQTEVRMLRTLITDVQAVTAIEQDDFRIDPRPVPIQNVLSEVTAFASTLDACRIQTETSNISGHVNADPERIGQVLRNLLSNACKHTPPGTQVVLRAIPQQGAVRIEVADDGPGIPPEDQARIFEKYARGHDRERRRIRGRGLGLYVSQRIVQLHGSELRLESEPDRGARFSFELEVVR